MKENLGERSLSFAVPYLARSEKDMGAVPGETPRTFCEPA